MTRRAIHERSEIARRVQGQFRRLLEVWSEEDCIDSWMAFHADEDHPAFSATPPLLVVNHQCFHSKEEIASFFRPILADRRTQVNVKSDSVVLLSSDLALHYAEVSEFYTRNGRTNAGFASSITSIWDLSEEQILHLHVT